MKRIEPKLTFCMFRIGMMRLKMYKPAFSCLMSLFYLHKRARPLEEIVAYLRTRIRFRVLRFPTPIPERIQKRCEIKWNIEGMNNQDGLSQTNLQSSGN